MRQKIKSFYTYLKYYKHKNEQFKLGLASEKQKTINTLYFPHVEKTLNEVNLKKRPQFTQEMERKRTKLLNDAKVTDENTQKLSDSGHNTYNAFA